MIVIQPFSNSGGIEDKKGYTVLLDSENPGKKSFSIHYPLFKSF